MWLGKVRRNSPAAAEIIASFLLPFVVAFVVPVLALRNLIYEHDQEREEHA